jgi:hypothetical protein
MKINNKTICMLGIFVAVFILAVEGVFAYGVSSQYTEDFPLQMSPGETKDIHVVLQNRGGATSDMIATGKIQEGADIAKLTGLKKEYLVPAGDEIKVNIQVSIPKEVEIGRNYDIIINFDFSGSSAETEGPLGIGSIVEETIPVLVVAEPPAPVQTEKNNLIWYLIIGVIVILILIAVVYKIKKSK